MRFRPRLVALSLLALCFMFLFSSPVYATTIVVNTAQDVGPNSQDNLCSLRVAIMVADSNSNAIDDDCATGVFEAVDVIQISPSLAGQTLTLSYDSNDTGTAVDPLGWIQSPTTSTLEIIGPTNLASGFTINANNQTRIFDVGFVTIQGGNLVLSNLTLQGGNGIGTPAWTSDNDGGAIFLAGGSQLTLNNVAIQNSRAARGGAIFAAGPVTITNNGGSYISNTATSVGGAIYIFDGPTTFNGYAVSFDNNSATNQGGVIVANPSSASASINIERSTFKRNSAGAGGVFALQFGSGNMVTVTDSTFSGNSASTNGGVIVSSSNTFGSTFLRSTFYNNTAASGGFSSGGNVTIRNSILYDSTCNTSGGTIGGSFNLSGGNTNGCVNAGFADTISFFDTTLRNNGGVLETHALLPGSNAIDAASQTWCPAGTIDQRSIPRGVNGTGAINSPQVGDCDIGAYEYAAAILNFATTNTISMSENTTQANEPNGRKMQVVLTLPNPAQTTLGVPLDVTLVPRPYQADCVDDSCSTAQIGADFTFANQTLTIPANATNGYILEFTIYAVQDRIAELGGEFAVFDLTAVGAAIAEPNTLRVSITDDDVAGVNVTETGGSTELFENNTSLTDSIQFNLNTQPNFNANVNVTITPDRDCTINNQPPGGSENITIANADWESLNTVTLRVVDDLYDEDFRDESVTHQCEVRFTFTTSGGDDRTGDGVGDGDPVYNNTTNYVYASIHDNDVAGVTITESGGATSLEEGGATDTYTIVLNSEPDPGKPLPITPRGPTIIVADPDDQCDLGNGRGQPVDVPFTGSNWNVPQTVTVTAYDDPTVELAHSCVITHTVNSPDPVYADLDDAPAFAFTPASVTATINDFIPPTLLNDPPNVVITTGGTINVSEATPGTASTFTVVLFRQPLTENVMVDLTASADPRIPGAQVLLQDDDPGTPAAPAGTLSLVFTPLNWDTPQTVQVFAFDDDYDETDPHAAQITATMDSSAVGFNDSANRKFVVDGTESVNTVDLPVSITDDDTSSVDVSLNGGVTVEEGGAGDSFTFTLGTHPYDDVTVRVDPDDQCDVGQGAGAAVDISVPADDWNQTQTVNVTAVDDPFIEGAHTCDITVVSYSTGDVLYDNLTGNPSPVSVTVNDNDFPRVEITTTGGIALDEADTAATDSYTVVLSSYADAEVTVNLSISDGESLVSSGGTPAATLPLTFTSANWNVPQTVTVTVVDDFIDEANPHNGMITHSVTSTATGYGTAPEYYIDGASAADLDVVIADNDVAGVTVTDGTSVAITEGGATDTYSLVLDSQPVDDVTIDIDPDDECDLGAGAGTLVTLTFAEADWDDPQVVTVTALDDVQVEGAHNCVITHAASSSDTNYQGTPIADVTAAITDNDQPRISINTAGGVSLSEDTPGTPDTYTVVLVSEPLADVEVGITVSDGQTQVSDGGAAGASLTLMFTPVNWNVAQTVSVFAVDDLLDEADPHTGDIVHAASSTAPGYGTSPVFVLDGVDNQNTVQTSIADNDEPSIEVVESGGNTAVSEGGPADTYTVALGLPPTADVLVSVDPSDQCDLGAGAGTAVELTFTTGNSGTAQTVNVSAIDDAIAEGAHNCTITHTASSSDASYNNFIGSPVTVTITDNDVAAITVTQSGGVTNVFEGGATDTYEVVLGSEPTSAVTLTVTFGSQCSATPTSFNFDAATWETPVIVTVAAVDDTVIEPSPLNCTVTNTATSADSNYNGLAVPVTVRVFDNDGADLIVTQTNGATEVDETGPTSDTYDLSLAVAPTGNVSVALTTDGQCSVNPSLVSFTTGDWNIAQTVTVTAVDDTTDESSPHPCIVTHNVSSGDSRYNLIRALTVSVQDDDVSELVITETDGNTTVNEADTPTADTYALTLPSDPGGTVNVSIATNGQCTVSQPSVTFDSSNWSSPQSINVNAVDDSNPEASPHLCVITHTMSGAATGVSVLNAFVVDNDVTSIVVLPSGPVSEVREEGETTDTIEVRLGTMPTSDVYVSIVTDSQCVVDSPALPLTFTIGNWSTGQLVTVRAVDDTDDEADQHPCQVALSSTSTDASYTGLTADYEVTVIDNDGSGGGDSDDSEPGGYPTPPATPLCMDLNLDPTSVIRAGVPDSYRSAVFCRLLVQDRQYISYLGYVLTDPSQIGLESVLELGVEQAVDVFSPTGPQQYVDGAVICLRGSGLMLFLSANRTPRSAQVLASYPSVEFPGYMCVTLPEPGTLVMVSGGVEQPAAPAPASGVTELNACMVTTQYIARFRASPSLDGEIIDRIPYLTQLQATGYIPGWYRVVFGDTQGWISADLVSPTGNCGI